jgi:hypothetical protein
MQQPLGEIAVVGHQEKATAIPIKPSDRMNPAYSVRQKLHHCGPTVRIPHSGDKAIGFIDHPVKGALLANPFSIKRNFIAQRVGFITQPRLLTVHGHPTGPNQFFGAAPRGKPRSRQNFLQSHRVPRLLAGGRLRLAALRAP